MSNTIPTSGLAAMTSSREDWPSSTELHRRVNRDAHDVGSAQHQAVAVGAAASQAAGFPAVNQVPMPNLQQIPSEQLLAELSFRGGHPGALADAALLCIKKSQDYNPGQNDPHKVDRTAYFPFGATSYAQMLHTKSQRFNSLVQKQQAAIQPNFESLRDTALDIINYAGFYLADPRTQNETVAQHPV